MGASGPARLTEPRTTMQDLTLALWQTPHPTHADAAMPRLARAAALARERGADVLITPEMLCSGYAVGAERVAQRAQAADGPWAQAVAQIARTHQLTIVYGYPERDGHGAPYNAAQAIGPGGEPCLNYRKTHLYGELDRSQHQAGSSRASVFAWRGWRLGLLICYDVEFPEAVRDLAEQGVDAVLVPTANMLPFDEVQDCLLPARALENRVYVAYANACGHEGPCHYNGRSTVCGPDGQRLLLAERGPGLFTVTLSADALRLARQHPYLRDRRRDLYGPPSDQPGQTAL